MKYCSKYILAIIHLALLTLENNNFNNSCPSLSQRVMLVFSRTIHMLLIIHVHYLL